MKTNLTKTSASHQLLWLFLMAVWSLSATKGPGDNAAYPAVATSHNPLAYFRFQGEPVRNNPNYNRMTVQWPVGALQRAGSLTGIWRMSLMWSGRAI